jgi:hypothetical protein
MLMFVGIDWASTEHAVCVLDQTGKTVGAFRIPHSAAGFDDLVARCAGSARRPGCRWRSNAPTAGWSTGCWKPATRWSRSAPAPSRPGARARSSRAPSPTPATPR